MLEYYETGAGEKPFVKWLEKHNKNTQAIIVRYLCRLKKGARTNKIKALKGASGLWELKIPYKHSSGLRVYFVKVEEKFVLLLLGGNKKSQTSDIKKAALYWRDYAKKK